MHSAKKTYDGKIAGLYDLEETLGRGHFAVVKLARHVFTGEKVAVKVIDKTKLDEVSRAHLFQEVRCMKLVQHPNVVRLYEVIDTQTKLYLILELGDGGDLYDYIMKHEAGLGEEMAKEYFRQIVRAISYCHQLHVVHRDLKPENVVFFERLGVVKLTDFGFSNKFCPGQKLETSCGSLAYSAPEILLGDSYDAPAVDVWSLGVILYMLVVGQAPFQEANDSETLTKIMDCKYTIPTHVSDACKRLIARMLIREPESRASLEDIASDPWLGGPPQVEYLPLVSRHQVTEEDHNIIINKMVNGNIATKEEVLEALDKNEYNHITATYFLLAERKLRAHRQEQAQSRIKQNQILINLASNSKNSLKAITTESANDSLQLPASTSVLSVPRTPGDTPQGRVRKCSIVQEEEDEEEYCGVVGSGQELTPPHSSLNRRGSRSEGKLNIAIQERIAEERRKEKKESPNTSPHPSTIGRVGAKDDTTCYANKRSSPTTIHSGIPASYIPGSTKWRMGTNKKSPVQNSSVETSKLDLESESELGKLKEGNRKVSGESPKKFAPVRTNECNINLVSKGSETKTDKKLEKVINSSQVQSPSKTSLKRENSELSTISLTDSATITIPLHPSQVDTSLYPKYKTMPSPTRISHTVLSSPSPQLNEIFEEGIPDFTVTDPGDKPGDNRTNRIVNYEQRRSRFHKARTASCSSSDASDDDSESRKKRAHKISQEKNNQRRDSHDDSSDSQDRGGSGGVGGNPPAGLGSGGDGMHNQSQSNNGKENQSSEGGDNAGNSNNRNQRQCNGENFRRNRRRTGETRLRESQSLNRITEVQESEAHNFTVANTEIFHERLRKHENEKNVESNINNNNNVVLSMEKGKSSKSSVARLLQSWSNTISSTKLTVNKRKYLQDGRNQREGKDTGFSDLNEQFGKHYSDEKENKVMVEKSGKKVKLLGRYFQVSKKLCIPLPSLISKGRLYKARSCGSIARDKITSPMTTSGTTSSYKPSMNGIIQSSGSSFEKCKSPNPLMNQSLDSIDLQGNKNKNLEDVNRPLKKSPNKMLKSIQSNKSCKNSDSIEGINQNEGKAVVNICDNAPSISEESYELNKNSKGDINKNVSRCPKDGICQMHMRDAAKCHLS